MSYTDENSLNVSNWKKKLIDSKYDLGFGKNPLLFNDALADIDERLRDLEHKVNPTAKKILSNRSQQMLLLKDLGVLDKLNEYQLSNIKIAKFLSILLNASPDNIKKDLSEIHKKDSKLKTSNNYKLLVETYKASGLTTLENAAEIQLDAINQRENKL